MPHPPPPPPTPGNEILDMTRKLSFKVCGHIYEKYYPATPPPHAHTVTHNHSKYVTLVSTVMQKSSMFK